MEISTIKPILGSGTTVDKIKILFQAFKNRVHQNFLTLK